MFYQTESLEITMYRISTRIVTKLFLITRHSFKVILTYILNSQVTNIVFRFINIITTAERAIVKEWPDLVAKKVDALPCSMMCDKIQEPNGVQNRCSTKDALSQLLCYFVTLMY